MSIPSHPQEQGPASPSLHQSLLNFTMSQQHLPQRTNGQVSNPSTAAASTTASSRTSLSGASAPTGVTSVSNPPTPDAFAVTAIPDHSSLVPLELPRSPSLFGTLPGAMVSGPTAADHMRATKGPGLMRRLSNRTSNKLRNRTSSTNLRNREDNTGPTSVRMRSGSRTTHDYAIDVSDLELDAVDEQSAADNSLDGVSPRSRRLSSRSNPPKISSRYRDEDGKPILPPELLRDGRFMKVTKRKQRPVNMRLDDKLTKISWANEGQNSRKHLVINDIMEVRTGRLAHIHVAEFGSPESVVNQWLSIIYADPTQSRGRASKALHLIAPDVTTCLQWKECIEVLLQDRRDMMAGAAGNIEDERYLRRFWDHTITSKFGDEVPTSSMKLVLTREELAKTCRRCHIYMNEAEFHLHFNNVDIVSSGVVGREQFLDFFRSIRERRDLRRIFDVLKEPRSDVISKDKFFAFLQGSQGVDVENNRIDCENLFNRYVSEEKGLGIALADDLDEGMSFTAFRAYFLDDNAPVTECKSKPLLDKPLQEYIISSSHNTYLTGWQWGGHSSAEPYVEALKQGCRCVEIDCWDGHDGKPWVTHGNTGTSGVSFMSCIKAINIWAFRVSQYPLIISLEVHCSPGQQKEMVDIMKHYFGTKLVTRPVSSSTNSLPTPEELKNRILVKVKEPMSTPQPQPPPAPPAYGTHLTVQTGSVAHRRSRSKSEADATSSPLQHPSKTDVELRSDSLGIEAPQRAATVNYAKSRGGRYPSPGPFVQVSGTTSSDDSDCDGAQSPGKKKPKAKTSKIIPYLGDLGVYTQGIKFQDFRSDGSRRFNHVYSFSESTFKERSKNALMKAALEKHNRRYLMRVYPKGTRANSSNFDPLLYWRHGVQMAATNWQTYDLGTEINDAMFASGHDRTGYVLKPKEIRLSSAPTASAPGVAKKTLSKFSVQIISARHLTPPPDSRDSTVNPYIRVDILSADDPARGLAEASGGTEASSRNGVSGIGAPTSIRTKIVEGNGWNPIFDEQIDLHLQTDYPGLVFVRFTAWHSPDGHSLSYSNTPLCAHTAKLSSLQQGFRLLHLRDRRGENTVSKLLVRIQKQDDLDRMPSFSSASAASAASTATSTRDPSPESPRVSEETQRSSRRILKGLFNRTPSERRKPKKDTADPGYFQRTASTEKQHHSLRG